MCFIYVYPFPYLAIYVLDLRFIPDNITNKHCRPEILDSRFVSDKMCFISVFPVPLFCDLRIRFPYLGFTCGLPGVSLPGVYLGFTWGFLTWGLPGVSLPWVYPGFPYLGFTCGLLGVSLPGVY